MLVLWLLMPLFSTFRHFTGKGAKGSSAFSFVGQVLSCGFACARSENITQDFQDVISTSESGV
jgi:hypothetical protein